MWGGAWRQKLCISRIIEVIGTTRRFQIVCWGTDPCCSNPLLLLIYQVKKTCHLEISAHYREVSCVENRIQVLIEEATMEHSKTLSFIKWYAIV